MRKKNMKTVIVGDIHGKKNIVQQALELDHKLVFIGDILDSWDENIKEQVECLDMLLESDPAKVTCLLGNHELSYLNPRMQCSGWNAAMKVHVIPRKQAIEKRFKEHYWLTDDILITHGGVSRSKAATRWDVQNLLYSDDRFDIGWSRGGNAQCGGIFWCDWYADFEPIEGLRQIVGHTGTNYSEPEVRGIRVKDGNYNIDCLDRVDEVLIYDHKTNTLTPTMLVEI